MSRAQRLLALLQLLRQHRFPVRGEQLAEQLGVSLRTLYRDIRTLQAQGARIEGEAGLGYLLRPGFMLPPLMFSPEELEALALGARWVNERGDSHLAAAAQSALGKIGAVLPQPLHYVMEHSGLRIGPSEAHKSDDDVIYQLRLAIRQEQRIDIVYCDLKNQHSTRTLWPLALGYFDQTQLLAAWCELRQDFRHFRTDRIATLTRLPGRFPKRREHLLQAWRKSLFDTGNAAGLKAYWQKLTPDTANVLTGLMPLAQALHCDKEYVMTFAPNSLILYVQDVDVSARFYQTLLGAPPLETFPDFTLFALQPEFSLGLQSRQGIFPPPQPQVGGIELCMSQATDSDVDALYRAWVAQGVTIVAEPTRLEFGYTFVAQDPDGHRLRVCATDVSHYQ